MPSPGFDGGLHLTQEFSEERRQSLARQPTTQHHRGSASDTSNLTSTEVFSGNTSRHQDLSLTTYSQSFTSESEPRNGHAPKPCHKQQPDQSSKDLAGQWLNINGMYPGPNSTGVVTAFDVTAQSRNLAHQNDDPWSSMLQGQNRQLPALTLPQFEAAPQTGWDLYGNNQQGESVSSNFDHGSHSFGVLDSIQGVGESFQNNNHAGFDYGHSYIDDPPNPVHQPQFSPLGYFRGHPSAGASLDGTNANFVASPSHTRLHPPASTRSPTLDSKECSICGTPFSGKYWKGNLARHMRLKHRLNRKHKCQGENCDRSFSRNDALLKHCRKQHPEIDVPELILRKQRCGSTQAPVIPQDDLYNSETQNYNDVESYPTSTYHDGSVYQFGEAPFRMPLE